MFGSKRRIEELETQVAELRVEHNRAVESINVLNRLVIEANDDVLTLKDEIRSIVEHLRADIDAVAKRVGEHQHPVPNHAHPARDLPPEDRPEEPKTTNHTTFKLNDGTELPVRVFPARSKTDV